jgi:hypothetical protein
MTDVVYDAHFDNERSGKQAKGDRKIPPWDNTHGLNDDTVIVLKSPF